MPSRREGSWLEAMAALAQELAEGGAHPLRVAIADVVGEAAIAEATVVRYDDGEPWAGALRVAELAEPRRQRFPADPFCVVQIVPTGIRCEIGGFAGDACPATNLLAAACDVVVTHPNAVNASDLNEMADNVLYVEGRSLDDFLLGHVGLLPVRGNRVGTFIDPTGQGFLDDVESVLDAARATGGIDCGLATVLDRPLEVRIEWSPTGCAVGTVLHPEAVLDGVALLLDDGAQAVGGVSVIHGVTAEMFARHQRGEIPNPSGGVEAIVTHLVSKVFRVPVAHAPLPYYGDVKSREAHNPRAAAEFLSTPHYFSVLKGLSRAPRPVPLASLDQAPRSALTLDNVAAIVLPASCLGGIPALVGEDSGIPVIAVRENATVLKVTRDVMGMPDVIEVESYLEAAGVVTALRSGICLESLRRPLGRIRRLR